MLTYHNNSIYQIGLNHFINIVIEFGFATRFSSMQFSECYFPVLVHLKVILIPTHTDTHIRTHTTYPIPNPTLHVFVLTHSHTFHTIHSTCYPTQDTSIPYRKGIYVASERL